MSMRNVMQSNVDLLDAMKAGLACTSLICLAIEEEESAFGHQVLHQ